MLYEPLPDGPSIRLLSLWPGKSNNGIEASLTIVSLHDNPTYEALSYVVGDTSTKTPVTCNGESIGITENLRVALLHLRSESSERVLWVDQICINQNNPEERNRQVSMMGQIFHKPLRVIVWLGPADEYTPEVWRLFSELAALQEIEDLQRYHIDLMVKPRSSTSISNPECSHPWGGPELPQRLSNLPPRSSPQWNALQQILFRPWFDRVWTFQEGIVSAHCNVHCGLLVIPWLRLSDACKAISVLGLGRWIGKAQRSTAWLDIQAKRWHSQKRSTLHFLLIQTRSRAAGEPKDRIFAIRALVKESCAVLIKVEYQRALQDIYSDAVRICISQDNCLSILSCVEVRRTDESARLMPSWVPDWRFKTSVFVDLGLRTVAGTSYFNTAGKSVPYILSAPNPRALTLRGFKVASIHSCIDMNEKLRLNEECLEDREVTCKCGRWDPGQWRNMYRTAAESIRFPAQCIRKYEKLDSTISCVGSAQIQEGSDDTEAIEMAFRRTVTADLLPRASGRLSDNEAKEFYPLSAWWDSKRVDDSAVTQVMLEHDTCVKDTMFNRNFFIASEGQDRYMGIALGTMKEGDCVCVLLGGDTPFLLRRNGDVWKFVAEAYVYGIMDGEAMERTREDGFEYEDFMLV